MNPNEHIDKYYKTEKDLIHSNGNDREAIKLRYNELKHEQSEHLKHIQNKTLEFIGRRQALKEAVEALNK